MRALSGSCSNGISASRQARGIQPTSVRSFLLLRSKKSCAMRSQHSKQTGRS